MLQPEFCVRLQTARMVPEEKVFAMGSRPSVCSTGDVCLALDYLEDPVAHGIVQQVSRVYPVHRTCWGHRHQAHGIRNMRLGGTPGCDLVACYHQPIDAGHNWLNTGSMNC